MILITVLNGYFTISIFSIAYELAVEITYPIDETNSCGVINSFASMWGFLFTLGLTEILNNKTEVNVSITCGIIGLLLIISFVLMMYS